MIRVLPPLRSAANMCCSSLVMTVSTMFAVALASSLVEADKATCPSDEQAEDGPTPTLSWLHTKSSLIGGLVYVAPATILTSLLVVLCAVGWRWRREASQRIEEITGGVSPLLMRRDPIPIDVDVTETERSIGDADDVVDDRRCDMAREVNIRTAYVRSMRTRGGGGGVNGTVGGEKRDRGGDCDRDRDLRVISLGQYLSSLRPAVPTRGLRAEVDVLLGAALLRLLGPTLGAAVIPALAFVPGTLTAAGVGGLAAAATAAAGASTADDDDGDGPDNRPSVGEGAAAAPSHVIRALGGMSLLSLSGAADSVAAILMAKSARKRVASSPAATSKEGEDTRVSNGKGDDDSDAGGGDAESRARTAVEFMWRGETAAKTFPPELLPNPFVVSVHWSGAVAGMEDLLRSSSNEDGDGYDPDEYPRSDPKPTRDVILPDLCIGFGDARSTHTNRQIVENRLLSVLLNRLGVNDVLAELHHHAADADDDDIFGVKLDGEGDLLTRPCAFIDALVASPAYTVRASRCIRNTAFGLGLCIRERPCDTTATADGGEDADADVEGSAPPPPPRWIHIPLGLSLRTGLHDSSGKSVPAFMTHSSIDLEIEGPVINGLVQFYQGEGGFAGWSSGHYPDVPWAVDAIAKEMDAVQSVRMAGLVGACLNSVATRMGLPMGGYGLTGVCNDSAAVVELAVTGSTDVYPLIAIGGYYCHVIRRAGELRKRMEGGMMSPGSVPGDDVIVQDLRRLIRAMVDLPNDVHPTPSSVADSERRVMQCIPENPPFALMDEARRMLQSIKAEWSDRDPKVCINC